MSYADGLLSTGERITYRNKQHPFVFIWGARYTILALIIAFLLFVLRSGLGSDGASETLRTILGLVTAILFFGGLAVAVWTALRYINQEYVLTNRRVIQVEGVLNRNSTDSSLEKINDAVLSQSVFGRMFDFGDLTVLTASESGIDTMKMLRKPDRVQEGDARRQARVRGRHGACRLAAEPADPRHPGRAGRPPPRRRRPAGRRLPPQAARPPPLPRLRPPRAPTPTRSPGPWRTWPTCAIAARSRPRNTRRRRRTCSRGSDPDRTPEPPGRYDTRRPP